MTFIPLRPQSHGELLDMVGELKEKLEGKYQEEMEREIQSRIKLYIRELTAQHEERVTKQMERMKAQYEERMAQITLVHDKLLANARKETESMKSKLAEFTTNNVRQAPFVWVAVFDTLDTVA